MREKIILSKEIEGQVTFFYYKDPKKACDFYRNVMGFELVKDKSNEAQNIFKVTDGAYIGIVDEKFGYHKASPAKPVMLSLMVADVDAWYQDFTQKGVKTLNEPSNWANLLRQFKLEDPEGYVIEIHKFL
jgi:predicted enzyme related to lactoylglutathione lyase